ncbi:hypothetical protein AVEN_30102-1 [Araneus ventricosus]|uniref:Uncharacterized protein n=1 Tax=Araneus ventricosus TaxID=182803 RepID=A0A4Y2SE72_ARAVE|nr:hypothetical protein AVEN_30102-1 [Araneus ventricosus]
MSPLTLKKSRASKRSVSKVSLDRRRQERMCSGDALATPHFEHTGKRGREEEVLHDIRWHSMTFGTSVFDDSNITVLHHLRPFQWLCRGRTCHQQIQIARIICD